MKHPLIQKLLPHVVVIVLFLIIAALYTKPALQGKVLSQHDVIASVSETKEIEAYAAKYGEAPLWANNLFGGMPTYQLGMPGNVYIVHPIKNILALGTPEPMQYFFLCCVMFYFLSQVLGMRASIGFLGSIAFAYCVYNPVIVSAGHITKIWCIAFMPALVASIILLYKKHYLVGTALTALFTCLQIGFNHLQISYYTFFIIAFLTIGYIIKWVKYKEYAHLAKALPLALIAGTLGVSVIAVNMLTTADYSKKTIRGGSLQLSDTSGNKSGGLSKDYAFSYSFAPLESFVLVAPHIYGGSNGIREFGTNSKTAQAISDMPKELSDQLYSMQTAYWGALGGTSGPPYAGIVIVVLCVIGIFYLQHQYKGWLLALCLFALVISWGKNFAVFNELLYHYLPLYNKFRAPSMAFVILQFAMPVLAMLTLQQFVLHPTTHKKQLVSGVIACGVLAIILTILNLTLPYTGEAIEGLKTSIASANMQVQDYVKPAIDGLIADRQSMFTIDIGKYIGIGLLLLLAGFLYYRKVFTQAWILPVLASFLFIVDVLPLGYTYLTTKPNGAEAFTEKTDSELNLPMGKADTQILKDSSWYRVLNISSGDPFSDATTSAYHRSVGGYHAAKLAIYQDLIENKISAEQNDIIKRYNEKDTGIMQGLTPERYTAMAMLGTKYIIMSNPATAEPNPPLVLYNQNTKGNCWFVQNIKTVANAKEAMQALTGLNPFTTAVINSKDAANILVNKTIDTAAKITLVENKHNTITYNSYSNVPEYAVLSEIYYDAGWQATIDGKPTPIIQTNYALRGIQVPAGKHSIVCTFAPKSYEIGRSITAVAQILVMALLLFAIGYTMYKYKDYGKATSK